MAELSGLGVLGENVVNEYGERLVKNINSFIATEGLQQYIDKRPAKRIKPSDSKDKKPNGSVAITRNAATVSMFHNSSDDFDEFDTGIDFGAISLPNVK